MTHEERMRAFDAAHVLEVLGDVFSELDSRYITAWRASADAAGREDWWQRQRARRLKSSLEPDCEGLEWWRKWEATAET